MRLPMMRSAASAAVLVSAFTLGAAAWANDNSAPLKELARLTKYQGQEYSDSWGYTAPDGREYALQGVETGTSIVDITDAEKGTISEVAFIPSLKTLWHEIKTYKNYAYIVTDGAGEGIQIVDLSGLPKTATLVATYKGIPQSHNLWVDEQNGLLYTVGGTNNSVTVLSLEKPAEPMEIGHFNAPTYVHDIYVRDGKAYLSEIFSSSLSIWDVSGVRAGNQTMVTRMSIDPDQYISVHNSWLSEDKKTLFTTEEAEGLTVKAWDITNEKAPKLVGEYLGENKLAHQIFIKGKYGYLAHYGAGLKILDTSNPAKMVEVAHWDKGDPTVRDFVGAWGTYPYFKSGKILISDMQVGTVVVYFDGAVVKSEPAARSKFKRLLPWNW